MLKADIRIENINYSKTLEAAFPKLKDSIDTMKSDNILVRLFEKLDDKALPIILSIMQYMSEKTKDEILIAALNTYSDLLCNKLNIELSNSPIGKHVKIGYISVDKCDEAIYLHLHNINCNSYSLNRENISGMKGIALAYLGNAAGSQVENQAIKHLWTSANKEKVLNLLRKTIKQYGFMMELTDISLVKDITFVDNTNSAVQKDRIHLSNELQDEVLDALVKFLQNIEIVNANQN